MENANYDGRSARWREVRKVSAGTKLAKQIDDVTSSWEMYGTEGNDNLEIRQLHRCGLVNQDDRFDEDTYDLDNV